MTYEAVKYKNRWSIYDRVSRVYYTCKNKAHAIKAANVLNKEMKG